MSRLLRKFIFELFLVFILIIMYKESIPAWFKEWTDADSFYALGFFVIGFNFYYIKTNFALLKEIPKSSSFIGIILVIISSLLYIVGTRGSMDYLIGSSLPILISGIILSIYGVETFKKLLTPIVLLALILPILPLHRITMPLQIISTEISSAVLKFLGLNSFTEGSILYINNFRLAVVAGCSGLKSLFSLLSL